MDLGAEHLLLQVTVLRFDDHRIHQCVTHLQPTPVLQYRDPADGAIGQQAAVPIG